MNLRLNMDPECEATEQQQPSNKMAPRRLGIIIPTYNAEQGWKDLQLGLELQGVPSECILIVDSSSSDNTRALALKSGYRVVQIPKQSFRHGATRQMAVKLMPWAEVIVFLTQDAIPNNRHSIRHLVRPFEDPKVGAVCGRQLPRAAADPIEKHARLFNYSSISEMRTFESRHQLGFRAAFFSNSFAAYRASALESVGGFPVSTIVSEEVTVAARMLMAGWKIGYEAEATAIHSHHFQVSEEFSRYFDIGVHHCREKWLIDSFGGAGSEGRAFVSSQIRYLAGHQPTLIPLALVRTVGKLLGYQLGRHERKLPLGLKRRLSGQPDFWRDEVEAVPPMQEAADVPQTHTSHTLSSHARPMAH